MTTLLVLWCLAAAVAVGWTARGYYAERDEDEREQLGDEPDHLGAPRPWDW